MGYRRMMLWVGCALLSTAYTQPAIDWQRHYGGSFPDRCHSIAATADGGFVVLAYTISTDGDVACLQGASDLWVLKLDGQGALQWQRCLGGSGPETAGEILQTHDGGYILVGSTGSTDGDVSGNLGGSDIWLVRLSTSGDLLWERCFGGGAVDVGEHVTQRADGSYLVVGYTWSQDGDATDNHGNSDGWLGHVATDGTLLQSRCYGGSRRDHIRVMADNSDEVVVFGGVTNSNDGDISGNPNQADRAWIVYLDNGWDITWQRLLGGTLEHQTYGLYQAASDTLFAMLTSDEHNGDLTDPWGGTDYWLVKLSPDGTLLQQRSLGGSGSELPRDLISPDGGRTLYVAGSSTSTDGMISEPRGGSDAWVVKLTASLEVEWERSLGGSSGDSAYGLCLASDGGLVVGGAVSSSDGDASGTNGSTDVWVVKLQPDDVGMGEAHVASPLRLYPNPATQVLNLVWDASATALLVHDAQGRLVAAQERLPAGQRQLQLNVEGWADGLYTVQLMGADQRQVQRFAKH